MIHIRPARPADAAALSTIALRSKAFWGYDDAFMATVTAELTLTPERLRAASAALVAEVADAPVGFTLLAPYPAGGFELEALFVAPEWIGQGLGRRLWGAAVAAARALGGTRLVVQSDPNALGFYLAQGARQNGATPSGSIAGRWLPWLEYELPPLEQGAAHG